MHGAGRLEGQSLWGVCRRSREVGSARANMMAALDALGMLGHSAQAVGHADAWQPSLGLIREVERMLQVNTLSSLCSSARACMLQVACHGDVQFCGAWGSYMHAAGAACCIAVSEGFVSQVVADRLMCSCPAKDSGRSVTSDSLDLIWEAHCIHWTGCSCAWGAQLCW